MKLMVSPAEARRAERDARKPAKAKPVKSEADQLVERLELKAEWWRNDSAPHSMAVYVTLKEVIDAIKPPPEK